MDRRGFLKFTIAAPVVAAIPIDLPATQAPIAHELSGALDCNQLYIGLFTSNGEEICSQPLGPVELTGDGKAMFGEIEFKEFRREPVTAMGALIFNSKGILCRANLDHPLQISAGIIPILSGGIIVTEE